MHGKPYCKEGFFRAKTGGSSDDGGSGKHLCMDGVYWANWSAGRSRKWSADAKSARPLCRTSSRRRSA